MGPTCSGQFLGERLRQLRNRYVSTRPSTRSEALHDRGAHRPERHDHSSRYPIRRPSSPLRGEFEPEVGSDSNPNSPQKRTLVRKGDIADVTNMRCRVPQAPCTRRHSHRRLLLGLRDVISAPVIRQTRTTELHNAAQPSGCSLHAAPSQDFRDA